MMLGAAVNAQRSGTVTATHHHQKTTTTMMNAANASNRIAANYK